MKILKPVVACCVLLAIGDVFAFSKVPIVEKTASLFDSGEIQAVEYITNPSKVVWHLIYNSKDESELVIGNSNLINQREIQTKNIEKHFDDKFGIKLFQSEYINTNKTTRNIESISLKDLLSSFPQKFNSISNEMLIMSSKELKIINQIRISNAKSFIDFREYDVISISVNLDALANKGIKSKEVKSWLKHRILTKFFYKNNSVESRPILEINIEKESVRLGMTSNYSIIAKNGKSFDTKVIVDNRFNDFIKVFHERARFLSSKFNYSYAFGENIKAPQKRSFSAGVINDGRYENKAIKYNLEDDGSLKLILSYKGQKISPEVRYSQRFAGLTYKEEQKDISSEFHYSIGAYGYDETENQRTSSTDYVGISASFVW